VLGAGRCFPAGTVIHGGELVDDGNLHSWIG